MPNDNLEALFQFGQQSRKELREFIETFPAQQWDAPQDFKIVNSVLRATPRKIIIHVVLPKTRHWVQIATMFLCSGLKKDEFHDFLFSPVLGGELRREPKDGVTAAQSWFARRLRRSCHRSRSPAGPNPL